MRAGGRLRWAILLLISTVILAGAGYYAFDAFQRFQERRSAVSAAEMAMAGERTSLPAAPFLLFRNTAPGQGYGIAATVPISSPKGERTLGGAACDRVYGTTEQVVCLRTNRGLVTTFEAAVYSKSWEETRRWALPGIPSRARLDKGGTVASTTVFVTGHSYTGTGFSTETVISPLDGGPGAGSLEDFAFFVNGSPVTAADRNIWGVTFVPGQADAFYATAASSGRIWLVKGSVSSRTLTAIYDGVECPSVSPDGTRIAFKKNVSNRLTPHWNVAVLDIASGKETVLAESRSVDDQIEWFDEETLLYGLARAGAAGYSDIWQIKVDPESQPSVFLEHGWSPSVVR